MYRTFFTKVASRLTSVSATLLLIFSPLPLQALDLLANGFGTVCGSKSNLPKYATAQIPSYPFGTQLGVVSPYVSSIGYAPAYIGAANRWNFLPNSKFGLQFTGIFDDRFKAVAQLVGRGEYMTTNNFYVKMDWAYLQYNYNNDLDFQFGRFRLPAFYYSDYLDVNHAQPWVQPPEEVYFIVGNAFRNLDGIKARYSYYIGDWTLGGQLYFGSMYEQLNILSQDIIVKVSDVIGFAGQIEQDRFTIQGSVMRAIYDTNLNDPLLGLVNASQNPLLGGPFPAAQNLVGILGSNDVPIIYVGLSFYAHILEDLDLLAERASIFSRGIISTAREGWYASLIYSLQKFEFTGTFGYSRPLHTEVQKYNLVNAYFSSPQYLSRIDKGSGAGAASSMLFQSYLGQQRSYGLDVRYDIIPSVALKGSVKYVTPVGQNNYAMKYILGRVATLDNIWVYRVSFDFVF